MSDIGRRSGRGSRLPGYGTMKAPTRGGFRFEQSERDRPRRLIAGPLWIQRLLLCARHGQRSTGERETWRKASGPSALLWRQPHPPRSSSWAWRSELSFHEATSQALRGTTVTTGVGGPGPASACRSSGPKWGPFSVGHEARPPRPSPTLPVPTLSALQHDRQGETPGLDDRTVLVPFPCRSPLAPSPPSPAPRVGA